MVRFGWKCVNKFEEQLNTILLMCLFNINITIQYNDRLVPSADDVNARVGFGVCTARYLVLASQHFAVLSRKEHSAVVFRRGNSVGLSSGCEF